MEHKNNIQVNTPRVMFAAMRSGSGKTTVTCGVLAAVKKQNIKVQAYKCGPDYIDPMFHRTVLGIDTGNLDTFFVGIDAIGHILVRDLRDAEMCVMEGVMGYYDGVGGTTTMASSYELSKVTETPVVLIVDAKGASVTLAAIIRGIMEYKKDSRIAGVILNRVSPMFYSRLKQVIETECGIPVLGYLPEDASFAVPSRHLGLLQPDEMQKQRDWVETVAEAVTKTVDINGIFEIAAQAEILQIQKPADVRQDCKFPSGYRIGVARDAAFSFYYRENLRMLEDMGAELVYFSPLADAHVPKVDALIFGGGYPELYAKQLYENRSMRASVWQALESGMPCHAECGGFLYLGKSLADAEGNVYEMVGFLDGAGFRTERLQRFGYVELAPQDAGVFVVNTFLRGHEFHYWDSTDCGDACLAWKPLSKQKTYPCMVKKKGTFAGFPHLYYAGAEAFFYHLFLDGAKTRR
ncbi:MAG: cobyrinate a,c-diamide synthase [Wujia sp.]|nr:cobyrinate a,c-diamide synthase [Wujia sp.]MDY3728317.1 cobyrinate a,c-diamide synthase [Wujia sp.]